jgi:hypothetical protein
MVGADIAAADTVGVALPVGPEVAAIATRATAATVAALAAVPTAGSQVMAGSVGATAAGIVESDPGSRDNHLSRADEFLLGWAMSVPGYSSVRR